MANTNLLEDKTEKKNLYGITPEKREAARKEMERMIEEQNLKPARTVEDLYGKREEGVTQEEIQAEIDDFMRLREEWREEDKKLSDEREKHLDLWV